MAGRVARPRQHIMAASLSMLKMALVSKALMRMCTAASLWVSGPEKPSQKHLGSQVVHAPRFVLWEPRVEKSE